LKSIGIAVPLLKPFTSGQLVMALKAARIQSYIGGLMKDERNPHFAM
jgi:hypothetical protein